MDNQIKKHQRQLQSDIYQKMLSGFVLKAEAGLSSERIDS